MNGEHRLGAGDIHGARAGSPTGHSPSSNVGTRTTQPQVCPRCHGVSPFAEGVSELRKRCSPLTCDAWTFTARLTKEGPKPTRRDGRADLRVADDS